MAEVFVSYSNEDRHIAQAIMDAVALAGLDVYRERSSSGGASFAQQMRDQFATARCVICLWSEHAACSTFMQESVQHAIRAWSDGRLVLATLDDATLPVGLRDLRGIPVRASASGIDATRLLEEVKSIAERTIVPEAVSPREQPAQHAVENVAMPGSAQSRGRALSRRHNVAPLVAVLALLVGAGMTLSWIAGDLDPPRQKARAGMGMGGGGMGKGASPDREGAPPPRPQQPRAFPPAPPRQTAEAPPPAAPGATPPRSSPGVTPPPEPSDGIPVFLVVLGLGVAIGAGSVWAWATWSRTRDRPRVGSQAAQPASASPVAFDPAHQVFVSYSRQDGRAVEQLVKEIEQAGYAVWIDRHSTGSQRYAAPIVRAIKTSRLVALMCSENSFTSDHVIREVYVAGDYKKPFIAFQLDGSDFPDDVLYFVSGFPRVQTEALDIQQLRLELARLVTA